jgi:uncharacterized membrane protein
MNKEKLLEFYSNHKGEVIGSAIGLIIALSVLFLGLIKLLFIALCVCAGYYIGKNEFNDKSYFRNLMDKILRRFNV